MFQIWTLIINFRIIETKPTMKELFSRQFYVTGQSSPFPVKYLARGSGKWKNVWELMVLTLIQWHDILHVSALQARTLWGFTKNKLREIMFPHVTGMWGMLGSVRWLDCFLWLFAKDAKKIIYSLPISLRFFLSISKLVEGLRFVSYLDSAGAAEPFAHGIKWNRAMEQSCCTLVGFVFWWTSLYFKCVIILHKEVSFLLLNQFTLLMGSSANSGYTGSCEESN